MNICKFIFIRTIDTKNSVVHLCLISTIFGLNIRLEVIHRDLSFVIVGFVCDVLDENNSIFSDRTQSLHMHKSLK